jgi:superfamily II DNA or RNA helicase
MLEGMNPWGVRERLTPRPYQVEFDEAVEAAFQQFRITMGVLPTGGGKTNCAGRNIARRVRNKQRVLVLAHTKKLVKQFAKAMTKDYGMWVTMEVDGMRCEESPVVCASIQSVANRIKKGDPRFRKDAFDLIVVDEGHRVLSPNYKEAITKHFTEPKVLLLTATPRRGDQRDLMEVCESKAIDIPITRLWDEGYLAHLTIKNVPIKIKLEKEGKGDFTEQEVAHAIEPYLESCADALLEHAKGRCTLVFLPLVETSIKMVNILTAKGIKAMHVSGESSEEEQKEAEKALLLGDVDVVCNSMLWTEGVDIRPVTCIMNLRPTRSWTLYTQTCGRGTRLFNEEHQREILEEYGRPTKWPVKKDCLLLDPLWQCDHHNLLQRPASFLAKDDEEAEAIDQKLSGGMMDGAEDADAMADFMDLAEIKKLVTHEREEKLRERLKALESRKAREVNAAEFFLKSGMLDLAEYEPVAHWEYDEMTEGQRVTLTKHGFDLESVKSKGHASAIIDAIIKRMKEGRGSVKQCKYAQSLGMGDAWMRSFDEVSAYINAKKSGYDPYEGIPD